MTNEQRRQAQKEALDARMKENSKLSYAEAWQSLKKNPKTKHLFEETAEVANSRLAASSKRSVDPAAIRRAEVQAEVKRMQAGGATYDEAWQIVKNLERFQEH